MFGMGLSVFRLLSDDQSFSWRLHEMMTIHTILFLGFRFYYDASISLSFCLKENYSVFKGRSPLRKKVVLFANIFCMISINGYIMIHDLFNVDNTIIFSLPPNSFPGASVLFSTTILANSLSPFFPRLRSKVVVGALLVVLGVQASLCALLISTNVVKYNRVYGYQHYLLYFAPVILCVFFALFELQLNDWLCEKREVAGLNYDVEWYLKPMKVVGGLFLLSLLVPFPGIATLFFICFFSLVSRERNDWEESCRLLDENIDEQRFQGYSLQQEENQNGVVV